MNALVEFEETGRTGGKERYVAEAVSGLTSRALEMAHEGWDGWCLASFNDVG